MEAAHTFAHTITLSNIVVGYGADEWESNNFGGTDFKTPSVDTTDMSAGDYILLKVTDAGWMFTPTMSNPNWYTTEYLNSLVSGEGPQLPTNPQPLTFVGTVFLGHPTETDVDTGVVSGAVYQIPPDAVEGSTYFVAVNVQRMYDAADTVSDYRYDAAKWYAFTVGSEATDCNSSIQSCYSATDYDYDDFDVSSGGGGSAVVIIVVVVAVAAAAYFFLL